MKLKSPSILKRISQLRKTDYDAGENLSPIAYCYCLLPDDEITGWQDSGMAGQQDDGIAGGRWLKLRQRANPGGVQLW